MEATLTDAIQTACIIHHDEVRKNGDEYILHPLRVMMKQKTLIGKIMAVLHDVIENSNLTIADLQERGYGIEVLNGLELLTHRKELSYDEYIQRLCDSGDLFAINVKIADLQDNMDMFQLPEIGLADIERTQKYVKALAVLLQTKRYLE